MSSERRTAPRVAGQVSLALGDGADGVVAETENLSVSGAYCRVERFIAPMTKLALQFQLPHTPHPTSIRCAGVVVRAEPVIEPPGRGRYHLAIFFTDLSERDRAAIAQFVHHRLSASSATS